MSDHIPDVNKLVSDTPRTDMMEQHAPVGIRRNSAFEQASDFSRQLERELNVANAIIRQQQLLDEENLRLQERIKRLEEWKESAMAVEREWNPNSLSKMLGGQLGESQRVVIMREVPKLKERINQLKEALGLVVPHCSWVHHSKKHQHKYGEPCPVVALIEKAKEAKP